MNKFLYETHSALFKRLNGFHIPVDVVNAIQSCTVPVAEHETLYNNYKKEEARRILLEAEVARLKKEHDADIDKINNDWFGYGDRMKAEGLVEGDRRATDKVLELVERHSIHLQGWCPEYKERIKYHLGVQLRRELGLVEEETK